jgi:hypothetical protein
MSAKINAKNIGAIIANSTAAEPPSLRLKPRSRRAIAAIDIIGISIAKDLGGREITTHEVYLKQIVEVFRTIHTTRPGALTRP